MLRHTRLVATALLTVALPFGLTACSGSKSNSSSSSATTSSAATTSQASSGTTTTDSAGSSTTDSGSTDSASSTTSDASGKPSKDDVTAGVKKYYTAAGVPDSSAQTIASCTSDKVYDSMSAAGLQKLVDGHPLTITNPSDLQAFASASSECASGMMSNLPSMPSMPSMPSIS